MAEMGFSLTKEDIVCLAFKIADNSGRQHPFVNGLAGRAWFEGFKSCHSNLTIQTPQPLSYNWVTCASKETIEDFFAKIGGVYGTFKAYANI